MSLHKCNDAINELKEEVKILNKKSKDLKQNYMKVLIENAKKDIIIRELKTQISKQKFQSFEGELSTDCLDKIKSMDNVQNEDNAFVFAILNDIYGESLKYKTISGLGASGINRNSEISRRVMTLLKDIFHERVSYIPTGEGDARKNHLSKCIRNAIDRAIDRAKPKNYGAIQMTHPSKQGTTENLPI